MVDMIVLLETVVKHLHVFSVDHGDLDKILQYASHTTCQRSWDCISSHATCQRLWDGISRHATCQRTWDCISSHATCQRSWDCISTAVSRSVAESDCVDVCARILFCLHACLCKRVRVPVYIFCVHVWTLTGACSCECAHFNSCSLQILFRIFLRTETLPKAMSKRK